MLHIKAMGSGPQPQARMTGSGGRCEGATLSDLGGCHVWIANLYLVTYLGVVLKRAAPVCYLWKRWHAACFRHTSGHHHNTPGAVWPGRLGHHEHELSAPVLACLSPAARPCREGCRSAHGELMGCGRGVACVSGCAAPSPHGRYICRLGWDCCGELSAHIFKAAPSWVRRTVSWPSWRPTPVP